MITDTDLMFEPLDIDSIPQWNVFVGGKQVAYIAQRAMAFPPYRVSISGFDDQCFLDRQEVMEYLLVAVNAT